MAQDEKCEDLATPVKYFYEGLHIKECQTFEFKPDYYHNFGQYRYKIHTNKGEMAGSDKVRLSLIPVPIIATNCTISWVAMASPNQPRNAINLFNNYLIVKGQKAQLVKKKMDSKEPKEAIIEILKDQDFRDLEDRHYKSFCNLVEKGMDGQIFVGCISSDFRSFSLRFKNLQQFVLFVNYHCEVTSEFDKKDKESDADYRIRAKLQILQLVNKRSINSEMRSYFMVGEQPMLDKIDNWFNCSKTTADDADKLKNLEIVAMVRPIAISGGYGLQDMLETRNVEYEINAFGTPVYVSSEPQEKQKYDFGHSFSLEQDLFENERLLPQYSYCSPQFSFLINFADLSPVVLEALASTLYPPALWTPRYAIVKDVVKFNLEFNRRRIKLVLGSMAMCSTWMEEIDHTTFYGEACIRKDLDLPDFEESEIEFPR